MIFKLAAAMKCKLSVLVAEVEDLVSRPIGWS
jgi:hypothetical protein